MANEPSQVDVTTYNNVAPTEFQIPVTPSTPMTVPVNTVNVPVGPSIANATPPITPVSPAPIYVAPVAPAAPIDISATTNGVVPITIPGVIPTVAPELLAPSPTVVTDAQGNKIQVYSDEQLAKMRTLLPAAEPLAVQPLSVNSFVADKPVVGLSPASYEQLADGSYQVKGTITVPAGQSPSATAVDNAALAAKYGLPADTKFTITALGGEATNKGFTSASVTLTAKSPATTSPAPVAALPDSYSSALGATAREMSTVDLVKAGQTRIAPVSPGDGYEGTISSLTTVATKFSEYSADLRTYAESLTKPKDAAAKTQVLRTADAYSAAAVTAQTEAAGYQKFLGSEGGAKLTAAAAGDVSAFAPDGKYDKLAAKKPTEVQNILQLAAETAALNPKNAATAMRNADAQLAELDARLTATWTLDGIKYVNGYGEVVGYDMTTLLSASALGLGLYQALYAAPNEAKKQREFQLKLMDMQFQYQRDLQSESLATSKEIAQIQAEAQVAAAEAGKSHGEPSSVNPGVHL